MSTVPAEEHRLYETDKTLWACLLFMKYTHKQPRWEAARKAVHETLTESEGESMRQCWIKAKEERRI